MLKEALEYLSKQNRAGVELQEIDGRDYAVFNAGNSPRLEVVKPPLPALISLTTLSGLLALIKAGVNDAKEDVLTTNCCLRVVDHKTVELINRDCDEYGQRIIHATATASVRQPFQFGSYTTQENFIIGLASCFEQSPDLDGLIAMVSKLTSEQSVNAEDDGISQRVTVRKGALKTETVAKPRVTLRPHRSFPDLLMQPASDFVFRVRAQEDAPPMCALFEADGDAWKADAMKEIGSWFDGKTTVPVIA